MSDDKHVAPEDEALVRQNTGTIVPAISGPEFAESFRSYKLLQAAIDDSMPEEIIHIQGKPYRKKGYWKALRAAFNLTIECVHDERVEVTLDDGAVDWGWHVRYRASAPSGSFVDGDGSCFASEKGNRVRATEHNVRAHAHTRASNRAISSLVGFGEVSADEMADRGALNTSDVDSLGRTSDHDLEGEVYEVPTQEPSKPEENQKTQRRVNGNNERLITDKQVKFFHVLVKTNGRPAEFCAEYLDKTFGSPDPANIPFSEFNDVVKWLKDDGYFEAVQ